MTKNPLGAIQISDFGNPRVITVTAREAISGGQFVGGSTTTGVVASGTSSFTTADIQGVVGQGGSNFIGVALQTVASGGIVPVAIDGVFLVTCDGSVFNGHLLRHNAQDSVQNLGSAVIPTGGEDAVRAGEVCGRALTAGASGGFCVAYMKA